MSHEDLVFEWVPIEIFPFRLLVLGASVNMVRHDLGLGFRVVSAAWAVP